jgi:hypothetical protein
MDKPWDWYGLSINRNILLSLEDKMTIVRRHHSALVIQRVWRMVVSNPVFLVCKNRLLHEYNRLSHSL